MAKPSSHLEWTVGNPDFATVTQEPTGPKKQTGWLPSEKPPREFMNWLFWRQDEWNKYFEFATDVLGLAGDLFVGSGTGQYATLQLAHNAAVPGTRIIVCENATINSTITLSTGQLEVIFKPGVVYTAGSAVSAVDISGSEITVRNGRWSGFTSRTFSVISGAANTKLRDIVFTNPSTFLLDAGTNTTVEGCVVDGVNETTIRRVDILNSQASPVNVTGLVFDKLKVRAAQYFYEILQSTASANLQEIGSFFVKYNSASDTWSVHTNQQGDSSGIEFSISSSGQVQYTSGTLAGSGYAGEATFQLVSMMHKA